MIRVAGCRACVAWLVCTSASMGWGTFDHSAPLACWPTRLPSAELDARKRALDKSEMERQVAMAKVRFSLKNNPGVGSPADFHTHLPFVTTSPPRLRSCSRGWMVWKPQQAVSMPQTCSLQPSWLKWKVSYAQQRHRWPPQRPKLRRYANRSGCVKAVHTCLLVPQQAISMLACTAMVINLFLSLAALDLDLLKTW